MIHQLLTKLQMLMLIELKDLLEAKKQGDVVNQTNASVAAVTAAHAVLCYKHVSGDREALLGGTSQ